MGFLKPKKTQKKKKHLEEELKKKPETGQELSKKNKQLTQIHTKEDKKKKEESGQKGKSEKKFSGMDKGQMVSEIWNSYARRWKLRRGWVTVTKSGRVVVVNPHLHQYPQAFKEKQKAGRLPKSEKPISGNRHSGQPEYTMSSTELLMDAKQKAICRI
jgi:hypothetical protein